MRLINVNTLNIGGDEQPQSKYAILSHRWGDDEVTFDTYPAARKAIEDYLLQRSSANILSGIAKVAGACKLCRKLKLDYLWIDTCCIDKRSLREESKAINSMFSWYDEAEVCLTYMVDVGKDAKTFLQSQWFTRGWTLQELLASRKIVFYDQTWDEIGTKSSLSAQITAATRISHQHLQNFRLASIATKMSWQAGRTTTRTEDIAYSMFGVFDNGMDIRYGERDKAFRRLQEEIVHRHPQDESILAWTSNEPGPGGVLAPSVHCFRHCAHLIVTGQSGDYRPRAEYRISGQGFEITAPSTKTSVAVAAVCGHNTGTGSKFELTLNCWDASKPSHNTVALMVKKDKGGFYQRTNRQQLEWANNTRRLKDITGLKVFYKSGEGPTTSFSIVMQL